MKGYRVIYHIGDEVNLKTKVQSGYVLCDQKDIWLTTKKGEMVLSFRALSDVQLFMKNGVGSMLQVQNGKQTIFISVVRFCIGGQFSIVNAIGTRKLREELKNSIKES